MKQHNTRRLYKQQRLCCAVTSDHVTVFSATHGSSKSSSSGSSKPSIEIRRFQIHNAKRSLKFKGATPRSLSQGGDTDVVTGTSPSLHIPNVIIHSTQYTCYSVSWRAALTYLGRVCTVLVQGPPQFLTVKTDELCLFSSLFQYTLPTPQRQILRDNFHVCLVVGPPMWWCLMRTCTFSTLHNPTLVSCSYTRQYVTFNWMHVLNQNTAVASEFF